MLIFAGAEMPVDGLTCRPCSAIGMPDVLARLSMKSVGGEEITQQRRYKGTTYLAERKANPEKAAVGRVSHLAGDVPPIQGEDHAPAPTPRIKSGGHSRE